MHDKNPCLKSEEEKKIHVFLKVILNHKTLNFGAERDLRDM